MIHTIYVGDELRQFIHPLENVRLEALRDMVSVQYFLPMGPFKPRLLVNTPLQFTENTSRQVETFECAVCLSSDIVRTLFLNNREISDWSHATGKNIPCASSGWSPADGDDAATA